MFFRIRFAVRLALLLALFTSITVLAKGGFNFISITGPGLDEEVRATDLKLTEDFFAFADFYRDKVEAPANPGEGYEITRYYMDGKREIAFDRLHYYPETGYVFYDGIVNGYSEYDREWYLANPDVRIVFDSIVMPAPVVKVESEQPVRQEQPEIAVEQAQPVPTSFPSQVVIPAAITAGLAILIWFGSRLRKPSLR